LIPSKSPSLSRCGQQGFEHEAFGVHEQVALLRPFSPSSHLLNSLFVASLLPAYAGRLDRLDIYHAGAWDLGSCAPAHACARWRGCSPRCRPYATSSGNGGRSFRGREVVGQHSPGASTTRDDVEDGACDLAQGVQPGASRGFGVGRWDST
jgi:hypothetical protein